MNLVAIPIASSGEVLKRGKRRGEGGSQEELEQQVLVSII